MSLRWIIPSLLFFCQTAWANNHLDDIGSLSQDVFKDLTSELGSAIGYKALASEERRSVLGFEISNATDYSLAMGQTGYIDRQTVTMPSISLNSGLPLGLDVGGFYSILPSSNVSLIGGQMSYALISEGNASPAVSIRGNFTRLTGVEDFDLTTRGLELSISKGFNAFTPYAGLGTIWIDGETSADGLSNESLTKNKYFMGFKFDLGMMSFGAEAEQTGDDATTSATFGLRF